MAAVVAPYSDAWREQYAKSRYLEFLSTEDLQKRYVDLLDNVLLFTSDGRPHLGGLGADTGWTRRIADVWAEVDLRSLGAAWLKAVEQAVLDRPYPSVKRAIDAWGDRRFTPERAIIKYGRRAHMIDFLERGSMRLTPASSYGDPSLNPAPISSSTLPSVYICSQCARIDGDRLQPALLALGAGARLLCPND